MYIGYKVANEYSLCCFVAKEILRSLKHNGMYLVLVLTKASSVMKVHTKSQLLAAGNYQQPIQTVTLT